MQRLGRAQPRAHSQLRTHHVLHDRWTSHDGVLVERRDVLADTLTRSQLAFYMAPADDAPDTVFPDKYSFVALEDQATDALLYAR